MPRWRNVSTITSTGAKVPDEMEGRRADATPVVLASHNPRWARMAAEEIARIQTAIGPAVLRVEHIGSTSISGIAAKPTIDLMPVVRPKIDTGSCRAAMESLTYIWRGEFGIPGRGYCVLERDGTRLFHVHIFAEGNENIARHIAFRDYLRAHPDEAQAYEATKRAAAAAHPGNSMAYNGHKSDWVRACVERALTWAAAR
jgi:GrpB-like predicted nucleotidyltransferase (UPF0157 family)